MLNVIKSPPKIQCSTDYQNALQLIRVQLGLKRLTIQLVYNEVALFTFCLGTLDSDVTFKTTLNSSALLSNHVCMGPTTNSGSASGCVFM